MKKEKLNLDELKVQSFVTELDEKSGNTEAFQGGWTGDCLSWARITCPNCDLQSIPVDECPQTIFCTM